VTALDLLKLTEYGLRKAGIEGASTEARWIVEDIIQTDYAKIIAGLAPAPDADQVRKAGQIVADRILGAPLAHIQGYTDFHGIRLAVEPGVFIPRPETEILVDVAIRIIDEHSWPEPKVLDLYSGSGCILLAIASAKPQIQGIGFESDNLSVCTANRNMELHGITNVQFANHDVQFAETLPHYFHIVTANPPYIKSGDIPNLQLEVARHENHQALDGGPDGLNHVRFLAERTPGFLLPGGYLLCEIGYDQKEDCEQIFRNWSSIAFVDDLEHHPRVLVAQP
jgi:release factor glutamine methyltransferase